MFDQALQALKDEAAFYSTFLGCSDDKIMDKIPNSNGVPKTAHQALPDVKVTQTEHQIALVFSKDSKDDVPGKLSNKIGEMQKSEAACPETYREGHCWEDIALPGMRAEVEKVLGAVRKAAASSRS